MRTMFLAARRVLAPALLCTAGALAPAQGAGAPVDRSVALKGQDICLKRSAESVLPELCIDFQMNVRLWVQVGEPVVHGTLVHWSVTRAALRAPNGRVMRASDMGPEVEASLDRLALALTLDVPVFSRSRPGREVLLRVDGGSSVRQGRRPMSSPGSPDWSQLLHVARPSLDVAPDAPLGRWNCRTGLAPAQRLDGEAAKQVVRERGFRFMGPDRFFVCENMVDIFGTEAVSAAIAKTCAADKAPAWCGKEAEDKPAVPAEKSAGDAAAKRGSTMDRLLESRTAPASSGSGGSALDRLLDAERRAESALGRLTAPLQVERLDQVARAIVPPGSRLTRGDIPAASPGAPVLSPRYGAMFTDRHADGSQHRRIVLFAQDVLALSARCDDRRPVRAAYLQVDGSPAHAKLPLPAGARCGHGIVLHGPEALAAPPAGPQAARPACLRLAYEDGNGRVSRPVEVGCIAFARSRSPARPDTLEIHLRAAPVAGADFRIDVWGPGTSPDSWRNTVSARFGGTGALAFKDRRYKGKPIRDGEVSWQPHDTTYVRLDGAPDGDYHVRYVRGSAPEDYDAYALVVKAGGRRALVDEGRGRLHTERSGGAPKWLSFRKQGGSLTRIPSPCGMWGLPGAC